MSSLDRRPEVGGQRPGVVDADPGPDGTGQIGHASDGGVDGMGGLREFAAAAAHDLRGLQAGLRTAVTLLRAASDDPALERLLSLIERQTIQLDRLTNDLFLLAVADTGQLEFHPEIVDLEPILRDVAVEHGEADVELDTPAGLRVWADAAHVQRVVSNLVAYAFHHGAPPVRITAAAHPGQVEIRVSDAGPGVPAAFVPRLFDRFARVGGIDQGAGLGLAIVAELVHLNGGTARYLPKPPGQPGATFVIRLSDRAPRRAGQRDGPDRSIDAMTSATQVRLTATIARTHEIASGSATAIDDALTVKAVNAALRHQARQTLRDQRRLTREGSALAQTTTEFDRAIRSLITPSAGIEAAVPTAPQAIDQETPDPPGRSNDEQASRS